MKYLALALALLLAVGSHAAPATENLAQFRQNLDEALLKSKEFLIGVVSQIPNEDVKTEAIEKVGTLFDTIRSVRKKIAPHTESAVNTVKELSPQIEEIQADFNNLRTSIIPKIDVVRINLEEHAREYIGEVQTFLNSDEMRRIRELLEEAGNSLKTKISENVEETKTTFLPIYESIQRKRDEWVQKVKDLAAPYIEEYKEQL